MLKVCLLVEMAVSYFAPYFICVKPEPLYRLVCCLSTGQRLKKGKPTTPDIIITEGSDQETGIDLFSTENRQPQSRNVSLGKAGVRN